MMNAAFWPYPAPIGAVTFELHDTAGTPSITEVFSDSATSLIAVAKAATGKDKVTINDFLGPKGYARVFVTSHDPGVSASVSAKAYASDDLNFEVDFKNAAGADVDASACVLVLAY